MEQNRKSLISIIIPVYQVEKYLKRCLKSIIAQTYSNYEIILVDDGSKDSSGKICDEFQRRFGEKRNIQVFHTENRGPSAARNFGISQAKGELLTFIDSDDSFMPDYLEVMEKVMRKYDVKLVQTNYTSDEKKYANYKKVAEPDVIIYKNTEAFRTYIEDTDITGYIWGKLYDRSLFDNIRYPENISHGQDSFTTFKFILRAEKTAYVRNELYFYFRHEDTLTGSFSSKRIKLRGVAEEMRKFVQEEGFSVIPDIDRMIDSYEVRMDFMMLNYYIGHGEDKNYPEEMQAVKENLLTFDYRNPYIKKKYRWMKRLLQTNAAAYRGMSHTAQKLLGCMYW